MRHTLRIADLEVVRRRYPLSMNRAILGFLFSALVLVGCSSATPSPRRLSPASAGERGAPELVFTTPWREDESRPLSPAQVAAFRAVLAHAKRINEHRGSSVYCALPPPNLSFLSFGGQKYYFIPPGRPFGFRLSHAKQIQFERLLSKLLP